MIIDRTIKCDSRHYVSVSFCVWLTLSSWPQPRKWPPQSTGRWVEHTWPLTTNWLASHLALYSPTVLKFKNRLELKVTPLSPHHIFNHHRAMRFKFCMCTQLHHLKSHANFYGHTLTIKWLSKSVTWVQVYSWTQEWLVNTKPGSILSAYDISPGS